MSRQALPTFTVVTENMPDQLAVVLRFNRPGHLSVTWTTGYSLSMGSIQWDGIHGESDTFLPEEDLAAAVQDAEALLQERPRADSGGELPDLDEARRRKLPHQTRPRPAS
jgi:hypothetical protein